MQSYGKYSRDDKNPFRFHESKGTNYIRGTTLVPDHYQTLYTLNARHGTPYHCLRSPKCSSGAEIQNKLELEGTCSR